MSQAFILLESALEFGIRENERAYEIMSRRDLGFLFNKRREIRKALD